MGAALDVNKYIHVFKLQHPSGLPPSAWSERAKRSARRAMAEPAVSDGGLPAEMPLSQMLTQLREASAPTDWRAANRTLVRLGFAPLPLRQAVEEAAALEQTDAMVPTAAATCATLLQMCELYEARGTTLERALADAEALRRSPPRDERAAGLKAAEYERGLAALQAQLDRARADGTQHAQQAAERLKTAELAARQLKQKVAVQAQLLRVRVSSP